MTSRPWRRGRRIVGVLALLALAFGTAVGPARIAAAVGLGSAAPAGSSAVGFLPEPRPIRVQAPTLRITALSAITTSGEQIALSDGSTSPAGTTLLQFAAIALDQLTLSQQVPSAFGLAITNGGSGSSAAVIGGSGQLVQLWGVVHSLDLCLSAAALTALANGYSSLLGSVLGTVLGLLGPLAAAGPCVPLTSLLPVLGLLVQYGVPLPATIPAANLDIDVYALKVSAPSGVHSLNLPTGQLTVSS